MKPFTRVLGITAAVASGAILSAVVLTHPMRAAFSQQPPMMNHATPGHDQGMQGQHQMEGMAGHHARMMGGTSAQPGMPMGMGAPSLPGQDAFGAIQEIVRLLEADPQTDWSKINLEALRQHLIDMNDVTLKAAAAAKPVDGGLQIAITGEGRTVAAIQRMIPAHAQELTHMNGWVATTSGLPNGVLLTVTSADPAQVAHISGLGFIGLLVSGGHHQPHHLAMAKGGFAHSP